MNKPASKRLLLLSAALLAIIGFQILPMGIMAYISFLERGVAGGVNWQGTFNINSYIAFLFDANLDGSLALNVDYLQIFARSFIQSFVTTVLCLFIGFPTALWMATRAEKWRNILIFLVTIPFWTNLLVRNFAWILLLRANGLLSTSLQYLGITEEPVNLLYNDIAVAIGLTYSFLPFMVLPIYSSLEKMDWRLAEAAFDLGATKSKALWRIIIPLSMPGIVAGAVLVFVPALGAYVTPVLLGGGKSLMIGNLIQMQFGSSRNWPFGAALSFALLAIVLLAMMAHALILRRQKQEVGHA